MRRKNFAPPPWLVLMVGVAAVSTASTFIRLAQAEVASLAVAAWRLTLASVILAPFAFTLRRAELRRLSRREWVLALTGGAFLALHFAAWITSLALTSVAASVALVTLSPLFVALLAYPLFGERPTRSALAGLLLAIAGAIVIGLGDARAEGHQLTGDLLALVGALAAAGYFLVGKRLRRQLSLLGYVFPVYSAAALLLLGFTAALPALGGAFAPVPLTGYTPVAWLWLLLLAVFPQILGHSSLNWALRHLPATYVSLTVLAEPIGSALLAWIVLHEAPTTAVLGGGALILTGLFLAGRK